MSHLVTMLMNEVRKPLEQMERNRVGYIDGETERKIYYKIDNRAFCIEINEVDNSGKSIE